ncbi:MAG: PEGA domain-containing protein [Prevotella sp.]|nr:PEGA domain-containing protein [Prevotella sp.]
MRRAWIIALSVLMVVLPAAAQQISVEGFKKLRKGPFNIKGVKTDKQMATLDFVTGEKGFTFKADGQTEVQAEEGDGMLTLKVPNKTRFLIISHSDYGQTAWKVPGRKPLKRKKRYRAQLLTMSPTKEYKLEKQWVVFDIQPRDAIVEVDSTMQAVRTGELQLNLPLGNHPYRVSAPFYEEEEGTFELTDSAKKILSVRLQPAYSYLRVHTPREDYGIFVDGEHIGQGTATSGHLQEGWHRLTVMQGRRCYCDTTVVIGRAMKKTLTLRPEQLRRRWRKQPDATTVLAPKPKPGTSLEQIAGSREMPSPTDKIIAPVTIKAPDDSTEIWVNRELVGTGQWEGQLTTGFYAVSTSKEQLPSRTRTLWIVDEFPKEVDISAPLADYGLLNVHSNVIGAEIRVNGELKGVTPAVVENLPVGQTYTVELRKQGFKTARRKISPVGNELTEVYIELKN